MRTPGNTCTSMSLLHFAVTARVPPFRKPVDPLRRMRILHRARKGLSILRRANEGYLDPLKKVLLHTYGRRGKRRQELMLRLTVPEVPKDPKPGDEIIAKQGSSSNYGRDWRPPPIIHALIKSQFQRISHFEEDVRLQRPLRRKLNIPEKNIWGKPMPLCRVRNTTRRYEQKILNCIFPPVQESEWELLRSLATGEKPWKGPVPRRRGPKTDATPDSESALTGSLLVEGPPKSQTFRPFVEGRPHHLTRRLMLRLWASVFAHTPLMSWDTEGKRWIIKWGTADRSRPVVSDVNRDNVMLLFGGLDAQGKRDVAHQQVGTAASISP